LNATHISDVERNGHHVARAVDAEINLVAHADLLKLISQVRQPVNRFAIGRNNDVADLTGRDDYASQACAIGRRSVP
jgi:hypothetical protein